MLQLERRTSLVSLEAGDPRVSEGHLGDSRCGFHLLQFLGSGSPSNFGRVENLYMTQRGVRYETQPPFPTR
jgi:hypothetical protein